jgi:cyclase
MRRVGVLAMLLAICATSIAVRAYQQAPAAGQEEKVVQVEKLKDNLFMLTGGGGNTAVFIQSAGVTVVDTKNPGWGQPVLDKIKELTPKPITTIVNTHTHGDHVSGNVEFPATVEVIVQENTKTNMEKMGIFTKNDGRGLPKRTFKDRLTVGRGADQIALYYFGRGHTNGDTMIVFPALRVMHMGDLFPSKQIPIMDGNNGGRGVDYADTLKKVYGGMKNVDTIIPGHSTTMTPADLKEFSEFIGEFVDAVRAAKKSGQTVDQIAGSWKTPEKSKGYAADPQRLRSNSELIFKELQ